MLDVHIARGAALTVGAIEVPVAESRRFGVLEVDEDSRVTGFQEKPGHGRAHALEPRAAPRLDGHLHLRHRRCWCASCCATPRRRTSHDFGKDIIPKLVAARASGSTPTCSGTRTRRSRKYWRDVGTLDAYYEASMDLIQVDPVFNLYDPDWPLRTYQPQFPPAKFVFYAGRAAAARPSTRSSRWAASSPAARCSARSCRPNVRVHSYCDIQDSILMPNAIVHRHARIRRAIIDRDVEVPRGARDRLRPGRGPPPPHRLRRRRRGGHAGRGVPDRATQRVCAGQVRSSA